MTRQRKIDPQQSILELQLQDCVKQMRPALEQASAIAHDIENIQNINEHEAFMLRTTAYGHIVYGLSTMCLPKLGVVYALLPVLLAIADADVDEPEAAEEGAALH